MLRAIGEAKPGRQGEEDLAHVLGGTMGRDNGGAVALGPGRARSVRDSPGSSRRKSALYGDFCMSAQCA